jgi:hypothetical protein
MMAVPLSLYFMAMIKIWFAKNFMSKVKIGVTTEFRPNFKFFIIFLKVFTIHYLWFLIFQVKKSTQKQVS